MHTLQPQRPQNERKGRREIKEHKTLQPQRPLNDMETRGRQGDLGTRRPGDKGTKRPGDKGN